MHKKLDFIKCSSFASFIPIKEVGCGAKPHKYFKLKNIIFDKIKNFQNILKQLFYINFSRLRFAGFIKEPKSANKKTIPNHSNYDLYIYITNLR